MCRVDLITKIKSYSQLISTKIQPHRENAIRNEANGNQTAKIFSNFRSIEYHPSTTKFKALFSAAPHQLTVIAVAKGLTPEGPSPWWPMSSSESCKCRRKYEAGMTPLALHASRYNTRDGSSLDGVFCSTVCMIHRSFVQFQRAIALVGWLMHETHRLNEHMNTFTHFTNGTMAPPSMWINLKECE